MSSIITKVSDTEIKLAGYFTKDTVPDVLRATQTVVMQSAELTIDLQDVVQADSAGLALLFEWLGLAYARKHTLNFKNVPEQLLAIARASEMDTLIPVK